MTTTLETTARPATGQVVTIGVASTVVAVVFTWLGAHDWGEIAVVSAAVLTCGALVFGLVVPRALQKESAGGTALALAVPALLLLVPAFWAGIPFVLGAAAVAVGNAGRGARTGFGKSVAGLVLGALAVLGYLAIYASDLAASGGGFLLD